MGGEGDIRRLEGQGVCWVGCEGLWEDEGDMVRDGVRGVMGRRMG